MTADFFRVQNNIAFQTQQHQFLQSNLQIQQNWNDRQYRQQSYEQSQREAWNKTREDRIRETNRTVVPQFPSHPGRFTYASKPIPFECKACKHCYMNRCEFITILIALGIFILGAGLTADHRTVMIGAVIEIGGISLLFLTFLKCLGRICRGCCCETEDPEKKKLISQI